MSQYVNLEMSYNTYYKLCDAVEEATVHAEGFYEIQDLVHLFDYLEDEFESDRKKQNENYKTWKLHEKLLLDQESYHPLEFQRVKSVLDDYEDRKIFEWNISEEDKFHLICELIDVFKEDNSD